MHRMRHFILLATTLCISMLLAQPDASAEGISAGNGSVIVDGQSFSSWSDYYGSAYFAQSGRRCGTISGRSRGARAVSPSDCTYSLTNPTADYAASVVYEIPVVVHIIEHSNGDGQISDALVQSQIDVLNEDFMALAGTPGQFGANVAVHFSLATLDPSNNPTTGITRTVNDQWHNDNGNYWDTLAWDTNRYMNVYTNTASGNLGYVPDLPQGGLAGSNWDRVVIAWAAFGRNAPGGPPFDQGRTLTHEVGHYLGLEHTFLGGCSGDPTPPGCYASGDLICDTAAEKNSASGCPVGQSSCNTPDPTDNYMDYSDDTCMDRFTTDQLRRMRCSLLNYRPNLFSAGATLTTTTTSTTTTTLPSYCAASPASGCKTAAANRAQIKIDDKTGATKDKLQWKWKKGQATLNSEFLDPTLGAGASQICLYDSSANPQPLWQAAAFAGGTCGSGPCWKASGSKGFKYKDRDATPEGITSIKLRSGSDGKAQVQVKGKGTNLALPALPVTLPVTVQYIIDDGVSSTCWQTIYSQAAKNDASSFKAKGP